MNSLPVHVHISGFTVADNCLHIGGRKLTDIMADVDVPAYIYDSALIRQRISKLRNSLPNEVELHYAMKANPMEEVVQLLAPLVDGFDVASGRELDIALRKQMAPDRISFAGPGKMDWELERTIIAGSTINIESANELHRACDIGRKIERRPRLAIRVNPDFEVKGSGMKMSGGPKPFGIDQELLPGLLPQFPTQDADFVGFHIFAGSQNLNASALAEAQRRTIEQALELSRYAPSPPKWINIGGGFGIPYFKGDLPLDLNLVAEDLKAPLAMLRRALPDTRVILELGRYIVGEAGIYVSRIIDRKISRGLTYLITNGGLHHHLAASGNFGQVIRKDYPSLIGSRVFGDETIEAAIVGPLCTPLDVIAARTNVPATTNVGDLVVVLQSGAYGLSASPTRFLNHPEPVERLL